MIEVEKKFSLKPEDEERLTHGAEFISQKEFTDTYYENSSYSLTTSDRWLRERSGRFELKVPLTNERNADERFIDQYKELENEEEIYIALGLEKKEGLKQDLKQYDYFPCATFTTIRKKFKKEEFIIDLDEMDFGYSIGEIERMVEDETKVPEAIQDILSFAEENGLVIMPVRGKLIEFLKRNKPEHFTALASVGIVKEDKEKL